MNDPPSGDRPVESACTIPIDDPDDPRVALYRNLKDRDLRQRKGLFLGESELVLERLIASRFEIRSVLLHRSRWERLSGFEVDADGVGSSLIRGENDFTADIVISDGISSAKIGRRQRPNPRLEHVS